MFRVLSCDIALRPDIYDDGLWLYSTARVSKRLIVAVQYRARKQAVDPAYYRLLTRAVLYQRYRAKRNADPAFRQDPLRAIEEEENDTMWRGA